MTEATRRTLGSTCEPGACECVHALHACRGGVGGTVPASVEELRVVHETRDHSSLASTAPGGKLQEVADRYALETGVVIEELVGDVLSDGAASDVELAAFAPVLHAALRDVLAVAMRE